MTFHQKRPLFAVLFYLWGGWISCAYSTVNSFYRFGVVLFDLCIIFAIEKNRYSLTNIKQKRLWRSIVAFLAVGYMTPRLEIPRTALRLVLHLRICPTIGYAPCAELARKSSKKFSINPQKVLIR